MHPKQTHYEGTRAGRRHPLAVTAFILCLAGIPLPGLVIGPIAVVLAGLAIGQMASDMSFRGRGLAVAAIIIGFAETIGWGIFLGLVLERNEAANVPKFSQSSCPSKVALDSAPPPIRSALKANVIVQVERRRAFPFRRQESFSGSGVVVGSWEGGCSILTARHLVDPGYPLDSGERDHADVVIAASFYDETVHQAMIQWVAPNGADLALLTAEKDCSAFAVPVSSSRGRVTIGERVFTVGNPHDLAWSYTEGVVSAIRETRAGKLKLAVIQTQTPVNPGSSGGGLYSVEGALLGIVVWTRHKAMAEGMSFALAYPDFLKMRGWLKEPTERTTQSN
ncbi:MAG: trypsin-like peptidase domain-containing protein [Pseudomonadota bacterium]